MMYSAIPDSCPYVICSVQADAAVDATTETAALLERLFGYPDVRHVMTADVPPSADGPVLPMQFEKGGTALRLFTTIATLGTPQDITL